MKKLTPLKSISVLFAFAILLTLISSLDRAAPSRVFTQVQKIEVDPEIPKAYFGMSLSLEDGIALVGTPLDVENSGAVYAFEQVNGTWTQQQRFAPSELNGIGWSMSRDGDRVLLGYGATDEMPGVYIYERVNGDWIAKQSLVASDYEENVSPFAYGLAVAIDGDIAVVGDPAQRPEGENNQWGALYVYERINGNWVEQDKLTVAGSRDLGFDVAVQNGVIMAGAYQTDNGPNVSQGAVFVFEKINGTWTQTQKLTGQHRGFGGSVNANDNLMVVGFIGNTSETAYVFERINGTWFEQQQLTPSDAALGRTSFGYDAAIDGNTIVITRSGEYSETGAAYIFTRQNGTWIETQKLLASDIAPGDLYGMSAAIEGDTIMIGSGACATGDPAPHACPGAVYVYTDPNFIPTSTSTTLPPTATYTPGGPTITPEPTATNTPLPDDTVELLVNGGFELNADSNQSPDGWKLKQENGDKLKCNDGGEPIAYEGLCAFQFKGGDGERSKLQQDVDLTAHSVSAGDSLALGGRVWAKGDVDSKVTLKVKYVSLPTEKVVVDVSPTGNATAKQWTAFGALQPNLSLTIADAPTEITLQIKHASASGKVRYDALSLTHQFNSTNLLGLPQ
jgi:hypothetical protein